MIDKLPMDNLYKFIVIAGMLLLTLPFTLYPVIQKYDIENYELIRKLEKLNDSMDEIIKSENEIHKEIKNNNYFNKKKTIEDLKVLELLERYLKDIKNLKEKEKEVEGLGKFLVETKYIKIIKTIAIISPILGLLLIGCGSILWYNKTQKWQDKLLRKEVEGIK